MSTTISMRGRCAGKRSAVDAALGGAISPLGRRGCFAFGSRSPLDLLDVLEPEQQLVLGQRLGASAEAMTLQLLDDLVAAARSRARSASSIAFSVPGSSGSASVRPS